MTQLIHRPHLKLFTPLPSFLFRATKIFKTVLSVIHRQIYVRGQPFLPFAHYLVGRLYKLHAKTVIRIFKSHTTRDKNFWNSFRSFLGCFPGTVALAEQCQWTMKLLKRPRREIFLFVKILIDPARRVRAARNVPMRLPCAFYCKRSTRKARLVVHTMIQ